MSKYTMDQLQALIGGRHVPPRFAQDVELEEDYGDMFSNLRFFSGHQPDTTTPNRRSGGGGALVPSTGLGLGPVSGGMVATPASLPVHEYWLEHKGVMNDELLWMRDEMLAEVRRVEAELLVQSQMLRAKSHEELEFLRADAKEIVDNLVRLETEAWRAVKAREGQLFAIQQQLMDSTAATVQRLIEREFDVAAREMALNDRRFEVEAWANRTHEHITGRERNLVQMARDAQQEVALAAQLKAATSATATSREHCLAKIVLAKDSFERVAVGSVFEVRGFVVQPDGTPFGLTVPAQPPTTANANSNTTAVAVVTETYSSNGSSNLPHPLEGTAICISLAEGPGGRLIGTVATAIAADGSFAFPSLCLRDAPPGTSHGLHVSVPRLRTGFVATDAAVVTLHTKVLPTLPLVRLLTHTTPPPPPPADAPTTVAPNFTLSGDWAPATVTFRGKFVMHTVEPFGLFGTEAKVALRCTTKDMAEEVGGRSGTAAAAPDPDIAWSESDREEESASNGDGTGSTPAPPKDLDICCNARFFFNELNQGVFEMNLLAVKGAPNIWAHLIQPTHARKGLLRLDGTAAEAEAREAPRYTRFLFSLSVPTSRYFSRFEHSFEVPVMEAASATPRVFYEAGRPSEEVTTPPPLPTAEAQAPPTTMTMNSVPLPDITVGASTLVEGKHHDSALVTATSTSTAAVVDKMTLRTAATAYVEQSTKVLLQQRRQELLMFVEEPPKIPMLQISSTDAGSIGGEETTASNSLHPSSSSDGFALSPDGTFAAAIAAGGAKLHVLEAKAFPDESALHTVEQDPDTSAALALNTRGSSTETFTAVATDQRLVLAGTSAGRVVWYQAPVPSANSSPAASPNVPSPSNAPSTSSLHWTRLAAPSKSDQQEGEEEGIEIGGVVSSIAAVPSLRRAIVIITDNTDCKGAAPVCGGRLFITAHAAPPQRESLDTTLTSTAPLAAETLDANDDAASAQPPLPKPPAAPVAALLSLQPLTTTHDSPVVRVAAVEALPASVGAPSHVVAVEHADGGVSLVYIVCYESSCKQLCDVFVIAPQPTADQLAATRPAVVVEGGGGAGEGLLAASADPTASPPPPTSHTPAIPVVLRYHGIVPLMPGGSSQSGNSGRTYLLSTAHTLVVVFASPNGALTALLPTRALGIATPDGLSIPVLSAMPVSPTHAILAFTSGDTFLVDIHDPPYADATATMTSAAEGGDSGKDKERDDVSNTTGEVDQGMAFGRLQHRVTDSASFSDDLHGSVSGFSFTSSPLSMRSRLFATPPRALGPNDVIDAPSTCLRAVILRLSRKGGRDHQKTLVLDVAVAPIKD